MGYHSSVSGESKINQCWNTGAVTLTGSGYVGGVVGLSNYGSNYREIINCYNTGAVALQAGDNVAAGAGGIAGWVQSTYIYLCYNAGTITGTGSKGTFAIFGGSGNASQ